MARTDPAATEPEMLAKSGLISVVALFAAPLAIALIAYWPYLGDYFALDDYLWLRESQNDWPTVFRHAFTFPEPTDLYYPMPYFRPLTDLVFKAMYRIFEFESTPYHLLAVGLHVVYAALAGLLVVRLARGFWVGLATAILFAASPAFDLAVVWISQMSELLCAVLSLCALHVALFWCGEERPQGARRWLAAGVALFFLALLTKQTALVFVALTPALTWAARPSRRSRNELLTAAAAVAGLVVLYGVLLLVERGQDPAVANAVEYEFGRVTTIDAYLGRIMWPISQLSGAVRWTLVFAYLALGGWTIAAGRRAATFFFVWSLLAIAPYIFVFGPVQYRYTYLATFPVYATIVLVVVDGAIAITDSKRATILGAGAAATALAIAFAWMPETRDDLGFIHAQAREWQLVHQTIKDECGDLQPGTVVYIDGSGALDFFGVNLTAMVDTLYDGVQARLGEPPSGATEQPSCSMDLEGRPRP